QVKLIAQVVCVVGNLRGGNRDLAEIDRFPIAEGCRIDSLADRFIATGTKAYLKSQVPGSPSCIVIITTQENSIISIIFSGNGVIKANRHQIAPVVEIIAVAVGNRKKSACRSLAAALPCDPAG